MNMTSRERLKAAWTGSSTDHVPLTTWCFGVKPKDSLAWTRNGEHIGRWYSLRMEGLHTWEQPWSIDDEFNRVLAWHSLGVDDTIDVSIPWAVHQEVSWEDSLSPAGTEDEHPVLVRLYTTPSGTLRHAVRKTEEDPGEGWVIQPDHVPLFEDYNIPRGVEHAVSSIEDISKVEYLYRPPDDAGRNWFRERMERVHDFSERSGVAVQAWSAFGMDGVVWMTGVEGAVFMAMDHPADFGRLVDLVHEADYARTELACSHPGVDIVTQRNWYGGTDFWSPKLFDEFQVPRIGELAALAHRHHKKFGLVITQGVDVLGESIKKTGTDVLYFVDPVQDAVTVGRARELFDGGVTLVGGINTLSLASRDESLIGVQVGEAAEALGPTNRFILHPVDALHPDTPWEGIEILIEAWKKHR
jgi:hypothetical protein